MSQIRNSGRPEAVPKYVICLGKERLTPAGQGEHIEHLPVHIGRMVLDELCDIGGVLIGQKVAVDVSVYI